jgi:3-phenylpropionate/trans-cinnamate dioxygenase ferredoxin reductase subunit
MMRAQTFVIVGAGLAGAMAAAQLRKDGFEGRITLLGEEAQRPYERPPLSKAYLRGGTQREQLDARAPSFYADNAIELWTSTRAVAIEPTASEVVIDGGRRVRYDRLLIASGASPRRLDIPGSDLAGIYYLRTVDDADAIRAAAGQARRALVIGGGWIGAEVAASLRQLGLPVALVAPGSVPLERVLGTEAGSVYLDLHAEHGVELVMHQRVTAFRGRTAVEAVETADGTRVEADLVVVGVGARPRSELAAAAGLAVGDGILVDEYLETSAAGIFAAGDVAAACHPTFAARIRVEHWDNAKRQGRAAARNMLGKGEPYVRIPYFYSDQYDLGMEYTGFAPTWDQVVFRGDPASRAFIAFWLKDGQVLAGMNANVWQVNDAIAALVASKKHVDVERLVNPSSPLDDIEASMSRAALTVP